MIGYNESHNLFSSFNYPVTDGTWQCVDEEHQEDDENKENYADDDVLLVISPDQVIQTLERVYKPREGCVWSVGFFQRLGLLASFAYRILLSFFCCD